MGLAREFAGWRYPDDLDYDTMLFAKEIPPIFHEALDLTQATFAAMARHARQDAFKIIVLATYGLHRDFSEARTMFGREMVDAGSYDRLAAILARHRIPLIDQHDYIVRKGDSIARARFSRDGHWSEQGHVWAAEVLLEYFASHPDLCNVTTGTEGSRHSSPRPTPGTAS